MSVDRNPVVEIDDLSVMREGRALAHVPTMRIDAGDFVALIGPNGAGKSSVIRAITGEWPYEGKVLLFGQNLKQWPRQALARRIAVMPQQSHLNFDFTVIEVLKMGRLPHRGESAERTRMAVEASINGLSLETLASRRFTTLSGGERQRVQFARVMAQLWGVDEPTLLVLDEPTSALDLAQQQVVLDQAWHLSRAGTTVVAVMHDLNMVCRYTNRVLVIAKGHACFDGVPHAFMTPDQLKGVFGLNANVQQHCVDGYPAILFSPPKQ